MKKFTTTFLLTIAFAILAISCSKEKTDYSVTVTFPKDVKADSLYLLDFKGDKVIGVTPNKEGKFVFTGKAKEIAPAGISNSKLHLYIPFILENDDINIQILDTNGNVDINGGKIHNIVYSYEKDPEYKKLELERKRVSKEQFTGLDMNDEPKVEAARKKVDAAANPVYKIKNEAFKNILNTDNPPIAKAIASTMYSAKDYTVDKVMANLEKYKKEVGTSEYISYYEKMMNEVKEMESNAKTVEVGSSFKDVVGKDRDGNEIKLSDLVAKNKYTILEFWASWCGPCRGEIPNLKKAYAKYNGKGLEILSVSLDAKESAWLKAMDDEKTSWPNVLIDGEFQNPQVVNYGITGIPASYLIDQNGKIVATNYELREFDLDRTLSKFIK